MSTRTLPKTPPRSKKVAKAPGAPRKQKLTPQQRQRAREEDSSSDDSATFSHTFEDVYARVSSSGGPGALLTRAEVRDVIANYREITGTEKD